MLIISTSAFQGLEDQIETLNRILLQSHNFQINTSNYIFNSLSTMLEMYINVHNIYQLYLCMWVFVMYNFNNKAIWKGMQIQVSFIKIWLTSYKDISHIYTYMYRSTKIKVNLRYQQFTFHDKHKIWNTFSITFHHIKYS